MPMSVFSDNTHVIIVLPKREAICIGVVMDACLDTVGNIEGRDVDLTSKQVSRAEENMTELSYRLMELEKK